MHLHFDHYKSLSQGWCLCLKWAVQPSLDHHNRHAGVGEAPNPALGSTRCRCGSCLEATTWHSPQRIRWHANARKRLNDGEVVQNKSRQNDDRKLARTLTKRISNIHLFITKKPALPITKYSGTKAHVTGHWNWTPFFWSVTHKWYGWRTFSSFKAMEPNIRSIKMGPQSSI